MSAYDDLQALRAGKSDPLASRHDLLLWVFLAALVAVGLALVFLVVRVEADERAGCKAAGKAYRCAPAGYAFFQVGRGSIGFPVEHCECEER